MGRHKKQLKSEKAKTKLKGKTLLKTQNVTRTDFKVKKISIKDQISEISYKDDGTRRHNLKDVLVKLKHHNPSFRIDALKILKEKISSGFDLDLYLGATVQGLCAMCLDMDKNSRRESFRIMSVLFSTISRVHLEPFFDIILSYLGCAMTHIQQSIQDDSLFMLDILLKFQPKLMAVHSDKIFNNFLDMISKVSSSQNRSLVISLANKMSTVKWRSKILERMNELLKTIITVVDVSASGEKEKIKCDQFDPMTPLHFPLCRRNLPLVYSVSKLLNKPLAERDTKLLNDDEKLKGYIDHLIPLLLQSWLEVSPSHGREVLTADAAITLKQVMEIFKSLWELVELQCDKTSNNDLSIWFRTKHYEDFKTNIFAKFPYQKMEEVKDPKKMRRNQSSDKEMKMFGGQFCMHQNLTIIYLYCAIGAEKIQSDKASIDKIITFLGDVLTKLNELTPEELNCVENTLQMVLLRKCVHIMKVDSNRCRILLKAVTSILCTNNSSIKEFRNKMIALVAGIILDDSLYKTYGECEFQEWISNLSKILCKPQISQSNVLVLSKLAKQVNEAFLNALKINVFQIIDNLSQIYVIGYKHQLEAKKSIMNLFFWIKDWTTEDKQNVCEYARTHVDHELAKYFQFVVMQ